MTEYTIQKFASFLVIKYSKINIADGEFAGYYGHFMNLDTSIEIFKCIDSLLTLYEDDVAEIDVKKFKKILFLQFKQEYMKELLSRCLRLSEGDVSFFEFLLVCIYIAKFSESVYEKYNCCKVLKLTGDCLEAVYFRKYCLYFQENHCFPGLAKFCRGLNSEYPLENVNGECPTIFPSVDPERNKKVKILRSLNGVYVDIELNDAEKKQIAMMDKPYFKQSSLDPKEDYLIKPFKMDDPNWDEDIKTFEFISEKSIDPEQPCVHCSATCGQYPKHLVEELKKIEVI